MADRKIRLASIGFGGRGGGVAAWCVKHTGGLFEHVAANDISEEIHEKACRYFDTAPKFYRSIREMVSREKIDAAVIGSPNSTHFENLREFEGLDIAILLEKPLDASFDNICNIMRFAEEYRGPILVGHCMRYAPILRKAKTMIADGDIGNICSARFVQNCHYGNIMFHNWRRERAKSGSMFVEKATHDLDVMHWFLERTPRKVFAVARRQAYGGDKPDDLRCINCDERFTCPENFEYIKKRWGMGVMHEAKNRKIHDYCVFAKCADNWDNEMCVMQYDDDVFSRYEECYFTPRSFRHRVYQIIGTGGVIEIDLGEDEGGRIWYCPRYGMYRDNTEVHFDYQKQAHYNSEGDMSRHFYDVAVRKESPQSTVRQAFVTEMLGFAAIESAESGDQVAVEDVVPPDLRYLLKEKVY